MINTQDLHKIYSQLEKLTEVVREDQRNNCHKLHHNVQCWSAGVFQGITYSITNDGCFVAISTLSTVACIRVQLNELLAIVPGTYSSGVYICKSVVNYLRHGNYTSKS